VYINSAHGGRHSFSVCPLPRQQATQACFDRPEHQLLKWDGSYGHGKRFHYMQTGGEAQVGNYVLK
jgi:hypothetical protein